MRWSDIIAAPAKWIARLLRGKPRRRETPALPGVAPWPEYVKSVSAVRAVGMEYCWIWEPDFAALARKLREAGINAVEVGLCSCAESPDKTQVDNRRYWIDRIPEALDRLAAFVQAMRAYRIVTIVAVANDCGFDSPTVEQYRDVILPRLRSLGTDGLWVYPVVEAENRRTLNWTAYYGETDVGWSGEKIWNAAGGLPLRSPPGWINHFHIAHAVQRPEALSVISNDSPINDWLTATGLQTYTPAGWSIPIPDYYRQTVYATERLQMLFGALAREGHGLLLWHAHFQPGVLDWAAIRLVGAIQA